MDECWHKLSEHLATDERVKKGWDGETVPGEIWMRVEFAAGGVSTQNTEGEENNRSGNV